MNQAWRLTIDRVADARLAAQNRRRQIIEMGYFSCAQLSFYLSDVNLIVLYKLPF